MIWNKALNLVPKLVNEAGTQFKEYWYLDFGPDKEKTYITIVTHPRGTEIKCTCRSCSIHGNAYICSAQAALILKKCQQC